MYTVYVLYSPKHNKIYIGYSSDVETRFKYHNELAWKGWTIKFRPWLMAHTEEFETKTDAMKREKQLKSATGRKYIWNEIIPKFIEK